MSLFRRVRNQAPGVLFIRDIDLMTVDREKTTSPELIQLTTQFLICFDGYYIGSETRPTQRKIFTLGSVSDLSRMDPACLRSGRFEWVVNLRNPILGERKFLLMNKAAKTPIEIGNQIAWNYFGLMSEGFTNAEVISIINSSTLRAIHNGSFCHTNESLNEGLSKLFQLQLNKKIGNKVGDGFFNNLHMDELTKPQVSNFNTFGEGQQIPFKTKCAHLLTSVKNWSPPKSETDSSVLTMQNIGMPIQPATLDYSQLLISELLDFMAEGVFVKQLQRCSPRHTFVTQTSYCEALTMHLNKNLAKGCMNYQIESLTVKYKKATDNIKVLNSTNNWEKLNYPSFKKLQHRTKLMSQWYKARTSCELVPNARIKTNRFGYAIHSSIAKSESTERFKNRIKNRLRELTKSDRSKYSAISTIRGTYGTSGFQTRLQRPVTGPVTQISKEFLEIEFN
jgi:SpoVK/Ycf46/Vps4 family AAA+-type ATPase